MSIIEVCEIINVNKCERKFRVCLVGVKTWRLKNRERKISWKMTFFIVWFRRENKRDRKYGGKFSFRAHHFLSSQFERKREEKVLNDVFYTNTLTLFITLVTWLLLPLHPYHFLSTFIAKQRECSILHN